MNLIGEIFPVNDFETLDIRKSANASATSICTQVDLPAQLNLYELTNEHKSEMSMTEFLNKMLIYKQQLKL